MTVGGGLDYEVVAPGISTPGTYYAGVTVIGPSSGSLPGAAVLGETSFSVVGSAAISTDWAVVSVSLIPPAPHPGDPVTFSALITAQSSTGSFPQSVSVKCQIDAQSCGSGTVNFPGPTGTPFTVSSETPWIATPGGHTLAWAISTTGDPKPSNNMRSIQFTVAPLAQFDFSISASPSPQTVTPGSSTSYAVTVDLLSGPPQAITLTLSGAPDGVSASFTQPSGTPSFTSTLNVAAASSAAPGSYTITITGTGPGITRTSTVTLTISQTADFQINVTPSSQTVLQGQSVSYSVNVVALNGFNSQVSLAVSGLPSGASGVFSVPSANPNFASTLTVTLPSSVPSGSFTLTVTGNGGGISRVASVLLTINETTQTSSTQAPGPSDLLSMIEQNSLLVIGLLVLVILVLAIGLRGRTKPSARIQTQTVNATYCPKCGTLNPTGNLFCAKCGAKLQ